MTKPIRMAAAMRVGLPVYALAVAAAQATAGRERSARAGEWLHAHGEHTGRAAAQPLYEAPHAPQSPHSPHGPLNAIIDFGAVPDGAVVDAATGRVGGTDNSAALQRAIDAAQARDRIFSLQRRSLNDSTPLRP
jgi:hypothetical protein